MNKVTLAFLIPILAIITLIGAAFLVISQSNTPNTVNNTPSPTVTQTSTNQNSNLKTYQNNQFSLFYPSDFTVKEELTVTSPEYPKAYPTIEFSKDNIKVMVTVAENTNNLNLNNALGKGPYLRYVDEYISGQEIKELKIDGVDAVSVKVVGTGQDGAETMDTIAIKDKNIYQLIMSPSTPENQPIFDQILSSFSFK